MNDCETNVGVGCRELTFSEFGRFRLDPLQNGFDSQPELVAETDATLIEPNGGVGNLLESGSEYAYVHFARSCARRSLMAARASSIVNDCNSPRRCAATRAWSSAANS